MNTLKNSNLDFLNLDVEHLKQRSSVSDVSKISVPDYNRLKHLELTTNKSKNNTLVSAFERHILSVANIYMNTSSVSEEVFYDFEISDDDSNHTSIFTEDALKRI